MDGSITREQNGMVIEELLQPYSEEEQQEKEINSSNSRAVFSPEFVPFYGEIARAFELTHIEAIIYGFIRYYSRFASSRFYFTDKQLSQIAICSESTAGRSVNKLRQAGLLELHHKVRAGGGTVRFILPKHLFSESEPDRTRLFSGSDPLEKRTNKNKINKNSLLKRIEIILSFRDTLPEDLKKEIKSDEFLRRKYQHLLK